jgi:hypothetical protein
MLCLFLFVLNENILQCLFVLFCLFVFFVVLFCFVKEGFLGVSSAPVSQSVR